MAPSICIAATFTAESLVEPLGFWLDRLGLPLEIRLAPSLQVYQPLLDPGSVLRNHPDGYNLILVRWDDLIEPAAGRDSSEWLTEVEKNAADLFAAVRGSVSESNRNHLVVLGPSRVPQEVLEGLAALERQLEDELRRLPRTEVLTAAEIQRRYPTGCDWFDPDGFRFGRVPFTGRFALSLATSVARRLVGVASPTCKVIAVDADNTLWAGICGEDGPHGVRITEPFQQVQRFLRTQVEQGRLLCLCSKNIAADIDAVFAAHPQMPLKPEHFVARRINWLPKSENLKSLAEELNLGLDSFLLIDDNPVEVAETEAHCPEVLALQLPPNTSRIPDFLASIWVLDAGAPTDEARGRTEAYRQQAHRESLRSQTASLGEFIASLNLRVEIGLASEKQVARIAELTQRTNQFNTTALRCSAAEISAWRQRSDAEVLAVTAQDRFGDYGLIGVALICFTGDRLRVESLLMSCRALGRGIEHQLVAALGRSASARGTERIEFPFAATNRNQPARDFLQSIATEEPARDGSETVFFLSAGEAAQIRFQADRPAVESSTPSDAAKPTVDSSAESPNQCRRVAHSTLRWIAESANSLDQIQAAFDGATRPRPVLSQTFVKTHDELEAVIAAAWSEVLRIREIGRLDHFQELGGKSIHLVAIHGLLRQRLGLDLNITTLLQHPTVAALAAAIRRFEPQAAGAAEPQSASRATAPQSSSSSARAAATESGDQPGIAVIGMAGRFPGAASAQQFWDNIKNGVESIHHFSLDELEIKPDPSSPDATPTFVPAKGVLQDIDQFDARFFGYLPREVAVMDPQQRLFLENCWEALENAGCDPARYPGAIGVYAGCYFNTYLLANLCSDPSFLARFIDSVQVGTLQTELGNDKDYLATRVSFKLNLRGPSVNIQSACSTSLVAIHHACQSLLNREADMALAGGVTITLPQRKGYFYKEGGMLSSDGRCRAFDAKAEGTVFSNASAVVVLKRLDDALADRDTIYAVIKGSACNNDGYQKLSYTAPSVDGQAAVIARAQQAAAVDPDTIGYIEAHGTATPLGDPIEIQALTLAFGQRTRRRNYCAVGSLKTNVGHLDVASGAAGVIKTAMALHERVLPPSLNFTSPNPKIDFSQTPFYVNTRLQQWPESSWPRRAGVSSFGVGGTNVHVVLEEPPHIAPRPVDSRPAQLLLLSAKSEAALQQQALRLAAYLRDRADVHLEDVAYTLHVGRAVFDHRRAILCQDREDAIAQLTAPPRAEDCASGGDRLQSVVFMFPGQGAQFPGMAAELYRLEPIFKQHMDRCAALLRPLLQRDLCELIFEFDDPSLAADVLRDTTIAQPAIFSIEYSLAKLWMDWGLKPDIFVGHSVGELTAACLSGVFSLEDALTVVTTRGRLMQAMPPGAMLSVRAPADRVAELLMAGCSIAAINAPNLCVVSGPYEEIGRLEELLGVREIPCSRLHTSHAFHSSMMDPALRPTEEAVARVSRSALSVPIFSTVTGQPLTDSEAGDPAYWGRNLRQTVQFSAAIAALSAERPRVFLEVGPGQTLSTLAKQTLGQKSDSLAVSSLPHASQRGGDYQALLKAAARLWLEGASFDWNRVDSGRGRRIPLPTYPFERKRYWVESGRESAAAARSASAVPNPAPSTVQRQPTCDPATTPAAAACQSTPPGASPALDINEIIKRQIQIMSHQLVALSNPNANPQ